MVIILHIGGEKISIFFQNFLVLNDSKRWQFCILINGRANVHISRVTKSFISSRHNILGHPDFTVSGSGIPSFGLQTLPRVHYAGRIRILWQLLSGAVMYLCQFGALFDLTHIKRCPKRTASRF